VYKKHLECAESGHKCTDTLSSKINRVCLHRAHCAHLMHTRNFFHFISAVCSFCHEYTVHTKIALSTLCTLMLDCISHCFGPFQGPVGSGKGSNKLLLPSLRSDENRRRTTAGNIEDGLRRQCSPWRRAEKPEKMTRLAAGGYNSTGYIALLHPSDLARVSQSISLSTDCWLSWANRSATLSTTSIRIGRCSLPDSNGEHDQPIHHMQQRILRRNQPLQSQLKRGASHCSPGWTLMVTPTPWENNSCTRVLQVVQE
jgi:hypothetical protein